MAEDLIIRLEEPGKPHREIPVIEGMVIGRHPESHCVLSDPKTSGRHARIICVRGQFLIEDLGSTNHTGVLGGPLLAKGDRHPLIPGTQLVIGKTILNVVSSATHESTIAFVDGESSGEAVPSVPELPAAGSGSGSKRLPLPKTEDDLRVQTPEHPAKEVAAAGGSPPAPPEGAGLAQAAKEAEAALRLTEGSEEPSDPVPEAPPTFVEPPTPPPPMTPPTSAPDPPRDWPPNNPPSRATREERTPRAPEAPAASPIPAGSPPEVAAADNPPAPPPSTPPPPDEGSTSVTAEEEAEPTLALAPPEVGDPRDASVRRARRPRLVFVDEGFRSTAEITADAGVTENGFVIGRADSPSRRVHCSLGHRAVSALHARIFVDRGHFFVEDLGSKNGTFLKGEMLAPKVPREIRSGDNLRFGSTPALFLTGGAGEPGETEDRIEKKALALLVGNKVVSRPQREHAIREASHRDQHVGEALLLSGALSLDEWVVAVDRATEIVRNPLEGRRVSREVALVLGALAALAGLLFVWNPTWLPLRSWLGVGS